MPAFPDWVSAITSLGGVTVLSLLTVLVAIYFVVARKRTVALYAVLSISGGWLISTLLKTAVARPRPNMVPHLVEISDLSFPSEHAMLSAVTYLTLGVLLAKGRIHSERIYLMGCSVFLTVIVGASRAHLGVHYLSDVIGGWCAGTIWAVLCWIVANRIFGSGVLRTHH